MPKNLRPCLYATIAVVAAPTKQSSTVPPAGHPARMHGSISFGGNVAKCAPVNDAVVASVRLCFCQKATCAKQDFTPEQGDIFSAYQPGADTPLCQAVRLLQPIFSSI
jgi:hypothetical protein